MNLKRIDYSYKGCIIRYVIDEDSGAVSLVMLPGDKNEDCFNNRREWLNVPELMAIDMDAQAWHVGSLVHLATRNDAQGNGAGNTLKYGASTTKLSFDKQEVLEDGCIKTQLKSSDGCIVNHYLRPCMGERAFEVCTEFNNNSSNDVVLDMLTSFSLDNLSPYDTADTHGLVLHRFRGGWSMEGEHIADSVERLNLATPWTYSFPESERFGVLGSHPVKRYFPVCAVEDTKNGVFWGATLSAASSWQMELSRDSDCYSLSGGIGDVEFSGWQRTVKSGERFKAPSAYISTSRDFNELFDNLLDIYTSFVEAQPKAEDNLPIIFNEWCTTWGSPSHDRMLSLASSLKNTAVKYVVIDAGWTKVDGKSFGQGGNGDWIVDTDKFPNGIRATSEALNEMGFVAGIWFEFEVTTKGAVVYEKEYDHLHLRRNNKVVATGDNRSFWDFRNPEVIEYLSQKVINFLIENKIGYLKVDYNGSIGAGCDGDETYAGGLYSHINAVLDFFTLIRERIPNLVLESCASGGHRLVAPFIGRSAMSSFSDAHEGKEIPIIGARLNRLVPARQLQMWAVLQPNYSIQELQYRLASGFFGRLCLSGGIDKLEEEQMLLVHKTMDLYEQCVDIIKYGYTRILNEFEGGNIRHPRGCQLVVRYSVNNNSAIAIFHAFEDGPFTSNKQFKGYKIRKILHNDISVELKDGRLIFNNAKEYSANVVYLEKQ